MGKRILKIAGILIGTAALLVVALVVFLSVTEFKPAGRESVTFSDTLQGLPAATTGESLTICSWNIGYAGLGEESDFFMDGGEMVDPPSQATVEKNLAGIQEFFRTQDADVWLLQEVDVNSARTGYINEYQEITSCLDGSAAFAYNYKCPFVPIPLPPMGQVESGIATISGVGVYSEGERISLPCPFSWPVRAAQIKRCLLVTRIPLENSDKELVVVNLHLEAYDDGEGKIAQTNLLMQVLQEEYAKGNYVIAGGDFNQSFPGALDTYTIKDISAWTPGILEEDSLPDGWQFAYDTSTATCRLLDQPYCDDCQLYVIDGFILSPNVEITHVETVDLEFVYSDHNPVRLDVTLIP